MILIIDKIRGMIASDLDGTSDISDKKVKVLIEKYAFEHCEKEGKNLFETEKLIRLASNDILGFGIIQPLFDDNGISEIMVNSSEVYYEKQGRMFKSDIKIKNMDESMKIIRSICRKSGRTVNQASPVTDACLDDGTRISIVLNPISVDGHAITIRKFPQNPITGTELIQSGFTTEKAMTFLKDSFKLKLNIFICGGAGTGKTTLLNVLANCADKSERIITIEDSAELRIDRHENLVRLETRMMNSEGSGGVSIRDLIRTSLRMRPDRIIVGEVRGEETIDMLQAMNTGHEGSISTGHANSCKELISRLETMVLTEKDIPLMAVRKQITMAIDIIVCLSRNKSKRYISHICELAGDENGEVIMNTIFEFNKLKNELTEINETHIFSKRGRIL